MFRLFKLKKFQDHNTYITFLHIPLPPCVPLSNFEEKVVEDIFSCFYYPALGHSHTHSFLLCFGNSNPAAIDT